MSANLLLVDDHEASLNALSELLTDEGYTVQTASSGDHALALVREQLPDVIITDLRMDGLDGMGLMHEVRRIDPDLPVILITAYATIERAVEATRLGAFAFVTKPLRAAEIAIQVRNAVAQRALRKTVIEMESGPSIVGRSVALLAALNQADRAARTELSVLVMGESGTGKELFARRICDRSVRGRKPFVALNCGAIPESLLEAELFGAARGAFTGSDRDRAGLVEIADGGTLFLDEIGELSPQAQVRLLRFLQEGSFRRVGDTKERKADVRIVAATHRDLRGSSFREDLYFRLAVLPIVLPPLRARGDDVLLLFGAALSRSCQRIGRPTPALSVDALDVLRLYRWPGNVRELLNLADRVAVMTDGTVVSARDLPLEIAVVQPSSGLAGEGRTPSSGLPAGDFDLTGWLESLEEEALRRALAVHEGVKARAAASLGLERNAFRYKLKKYGILDSDKADE